MVGCVMVFGGAVLERDKSVSSTLCPGRRTGTLAPARLPAT
jgi:hypothetical protein